MNIKFFRNKNKIKRTTDLREYLAKYHPKISSYSFYFIFIVFLDEY